jgi:hypothetical protein
MAIPAYSTGGAIVQSDLRYMITTKPLFQAYAFYSQSIPTSGLTAIILDTEVVDRYNMHSGSSPQVTIGRELGWYRVTGHVAIGSPGSTGVSFEAGIWKNGVIVQFSYRRTATRSTSDGPCILLEALIQATGPTDYVEIMAITAFGGNQATLGPNVGGGGLGGSGQGASMAIEFIGT